MRRAFVLDVLGIIRGNFNEIIVVVNEDGDAMIGIKKVISKFDNIVK